MPEVADIIQARNAESAAFERWYQLTQIGVSAEREAEAWSAYERAVAHAEQMEKIFYGRNDPTV